MFTTFKIFGWRLFAGLAVVLVFGGSASAQSTGPSHGDSEFIDIAGSQLSQIILTESQFNNLSLNFRNRIFQFTRSGGGSGGQQTTSRGGGAGLSAGNGALVNGGWVNFSLNRTVDESVGVPTEGNTYTGIVGYDRLVWDEKLLLGLALIADGSEFSTLYNAGDLSSRSIGVVPYVAWKVTDALSLSFIANYSRGTTDTSRIDGNGAISTGEYDFDRWFVQGGADYEILKGNWAFVARTEVSYGQERSDGYTESNGGVVGDQTTVVGTWRIGGQVGYTFTLDEAGGGFAEPYVLFGYELDFNKTRIRTPVGVAPHANDMDQFNVGGGVNVYVGDNWSANVEALGAVGRENVTNFILSGTLRYQF